MSETSVWRNMIDATKDQIIDGPRDADSMTRRIRELRRGAPDGFGALAIDEALYELMFESRASA